MGFSLLISSSAWSIETPWRISTEFHWIMPLSIARLRTDLTFFALTIATLLCSVEMIGPARYSTPSLSANLGISGARFRKNFRMVSLAVGHWSGGCDAMMANFSTAFPSDPHSRWRANTLVLRVATYQLRLATGSHRGHSHKIR